MIQATAKTRNRQQSSTVRPTVCHVIHALGVGGAEVLVDVMVREMADDYRCVIAVLDEIGTIGEQLRADGFAVEHLHRQPGIDRGCARATCAMPPAGMDPLEDLLSLPPSEPGDGAFGPANSTGSSTSSRRSRKKSEMWKLSRKASCRF